MIVLNRRPTIQFMTGNTSELGGYICRFTPRASASVPQSGVSRSLMTAAERVIPGAVPSNSMYWPGCSSLAAITCSRARI